MLRMPLAVLHVCPPQVFVTRDDFVFDRGSWTVVAERYSRHTFNIASSNRLGMV